MSWNVISEGDLLTRISGTELSSLRAAALATGQADPISAIITQITDEIHGYIPSSVVPPSATAIPSRVLSAALDRIIWEIMKRPGATIIDDENGSRAKANAAATQLFVRMADGLFSIEDPITGASVSLTGTSVVNTPTQHDHFDGL